jgi:hypothetical protein
MTMLAFACWWWIPITAAILLFLYLVVLPLYVWRSFRFDLFAAIEPIEADDPRVSTDFLDFIAWVADQVEPLGFRRAGLVIHEEAVPNTTAFVGLFLHAASADYAAAYQILSRPGPEARTVNYSVEFVSLFDDGSGTATFNADQPEGLPLLERHHKWRFPAMADLALLHALHTELNLERGGGPRQRHYGLSPAEFFRQNVRQQLELHVQAGNMIREGDGGSLRLALKCVPVSICGALSPFSTIRSRLAEHRARSILARLGHSPHYERLNEQQWRTVEARFFPFQDDERVD